MQYKALAIIAALSAAAPPVLRSQNRTSIGGYGEIHFVKPSGAAATANVKRFVIFLGHSFSERLSFRSELEVEDAKIEGGSAGGEVSLEQLYVDYRLGERATLRTGLVLIPVGIVNETHEPPTFNGVARPAYHHDVIPTTWREIGMGLVGRLPGDGFAYRVFVVNGLRASAFSGAEGIRGGRQEGRDANFENPSLTGRIEYARPGLKLGGSFWYGGTTAGDTLLGRGTFAMPLAVLAADVQWDRGPFAVRAEAGTIAIDGASRINSVYGADAGTTVRGGYVEAAVNTLRVLAPASSQRLNLFLRHERYDTHAAVPAGTGRNADFARRVTTAGLTWLPISEVAFKADYTLLRTRSGTGEGDVLSLGVGFRF